MLGRVLPPSQHSSVHLFFLCFFGFPRFFLAICGLYYFGSCVLFLVFPRVFAHLLLKTIRMARSTSVVLEYCHCIVALEVLQ